MTKKKRTICSAPIVGHFSPEAAAACPVHRDAAVAAHGEGLPVATMPKPARIPTGRLSATTPGGVVVALVDIGEGLHGTYDPSDPDDVRVYRVTVRPEDGKDADVISVGTDVPVEDPRVDPERVLDNIASTFGDRRFSDIHLTEVTMMTYGTMVEGALR